MGGGGDRGGCGIKEVPHKELQKEKTAIENVKTLKITRFLSKNHYFLNKK